MQCFSIITIHIILILHNCIHFNLLVNLKCQTAPRVGNGLWLKVDEISAMLSAMQILHTSIILWENSLDELGQLGAIDEPWRKIHLKWQKSLIRSFFVKVYLEVVPHLDNLVLCKSWLLVKCFSLSLGSSTILEWIDFSNISG